jgi:outer membrane protein TolC
MKTMPFTPRTLMLAVLSAALLGGCASFSPDGGFDAIQSATQSRLQQDVVWSRDDASRSQTQARIDALLAQPLSADDAVQIALLNNPGLQAAFNTLGIAEADWVAARRLPNPGFSIGRFTRGSEVEWERSLHLNLARLLTMPMRAGIEQRLFEQTRQALVLDVLRLAAETRKAWVVAVAARQTAQYQQQAMEAAEAGAELARRMAQVGNWSKLKQAREQSFYADAALAVARAGQAELAGARAPGAADGTDASRPGAVARRLPDLPASVPRCRISSSRRWSRGSTCRWRSCRPSAGAESGPHPPHPLHQRAGTRHQPQQLERGAGAARLRNQLRTAAVRLGAEPRGGRRVALPAGAGAAREAAVNARSEVREAYAMQQGQYAIARHLRDEVVPLKQRISEENLLRYNGMLIGVFELLADARSQIASVNAAIEAQRDFWLADADLAMALVGTPGKMAVTSASSAPAEAGGGH